MVSLLGMVVLFGLKHSFQDQLQKRGLSLAKNIASNSLFGISTEDQSFLMPMVKQISEESDIVYLIIMDSSGKVLAHTIEHEIGKRFDDRLTRQALKSEQPAVFSHKEGSDRLYDIVVPAYLKSMSQDSSTAGKVGEKIGVIRLGVSLKGIQDELNKVLRLALLVGSLVITAGIFFSLLFVRIIVTPLEKMTKVAVQIAGGDFSQAITFTTGDEVGILADAFSKMSTGLSGMIKRIQETSRQMTLVADQMRVNTKQVSDGAIHQAEAAEKTSSSIEEMSASVKNISENIDSLSSSSQSASSSLAEISAAINQVASSATTLSSSVEGTASSLLQMSGSIGQVADNIDMLSSSAEDTVSSITEMNASIIEVGKNAKESARLSEKVSQDAAGLGAGAMEKTIQGMEKIKKTVDQSAYVIGRLDERTEHIGKILTVIDEVTRQTNLLALNAAILAAKAGNEGQGFSVVAGEIKNLADRTGASTKEIAQLIKDVQSEAKDAVIAIKEGTQSVEEGVQLSINARESLNQILDSSKQSSEMSRQIEKATQEQIKATNQVTELMNKMNGMVQQINSAMQEQERGTVDITKASEKMRTITQQVKTSTEEQAKGSKQISDTVENITEKIQQIAQAMNEQKRGNDVIRKSMVEIYRITQVSVEMVQQMNQAVEGLIHQAKLLNSEVSRFKV